jgi:hypothetical protein
LPTGFSPYHIHIHIHIHTHFDECSSLDLLREDAEWLHAQKSLLLHGNLDDGVAIGSSFNSLKQSRTLWSSGAALFRMFHFLFVHGQKYI